MVYMSLGSEGTNARHNFASPSHSFYCLVTKSCSFYQKSYHLFGGYSLFWALIRTNTFVAICQRYWLFSMESIRITISKLYNLKEFFLCFRPFENLNWPGFKPIYPKIIFEKTNMESLRNIWYIFENLKYSFWNNKFRLHSNFRSEAV